MWVCLNDGFLSIVEPHPADYNAFKTEEEQEYLKTCYSVRARRYEDIQNFIKEYNTTIYENFGSDYAYRAFIPKEIVRDMVMKKMEEIDYYNFKNSVSDPDLHNLYEKMWVDHYRYQIW